MRTSELVFSHKLELIKREAISSEWAAVYGKESAVNREANINQQSVQTESGGSGFVFKFYKYID